MGTIERQLKFIASVRNKFKNGIEVDFSVDSVAVIQGEDFWVVVEYVERGGNYVTLIEVRLFPLFGRSSDESKEIYDATTDAITFSVNPEKRTGYMHGCWPISDNHKVTAGPGLPRGKYLLKCY